MTKEEWRDIEGFEGLYQVSNKGRVRNSKGLIKKPQRSKEKRMRVMLYKGKYRKNCTVHRLVAKAFLENPNNYPEINHIDGNPSNNDITNLEWCDMSYNQWHAYHNGLKPKNKEYNEAHKKPIIRNDGKRYDCAYAVASDLNVSVCSVRDVLKGRSRTCKGYGFKYD